MRNIFFLAFLGLCLTACFPDPPRADEGGGDDGGGGGGDDGGGDDGSGSFDAVVYGDQIQPLLDVTCIASCHNADGAILGDFALKPNAAAGSQELTDNIATIVGDYIDTSLSDATLALIYVKSTDNHGGANLPDPKPLEDWIAAGLSGGGGDGGDIGNFDEAVFRQQVQPLLDASCISACHNLDGTVLGEFGLNANAAVGSAELTQNVSTIVADYVDSNLSPDQAQQALIYVKSTDGHASSLPDPGPLSDWLMAGLSPSLWGWDERFALNGR